MRFLHSNPSKQQSRRIQMKSVLLAIALSLSFISCDSQNQPNNNEDLTYTFYWSVEEMKGTEDIFLVNVTLYEYDENDVQTCQWIIEDILYGTEKEFTRKKESKYLRVFFEISDRNGQHADGYWIDNIYNLSQERDIEVNNYSKFTKFEPQL